MQRFVRLKRPQTIAPPNLTLVLQSHGHQTEMGAMS
jgi:hypothetical protein